jgi:hypothetical protein
MCTVGKAYFVLYIVHYVSCGVCIPKLNTVCNSVSVLVLCVRVSGMLAEKWCVKRWFDEDG